MKKRKTLAMGLAVAMAVSCLAGCGGDDKKASSDGKTEQVLNISNNSVVVRTEPADQHNWPVTQHLTWYWSTR